MTAMGWAAPAADVATEDVVVEPSDGPTVEDHMGVTSSPLLLIDLVKSP